jgi:hypothetical protein
VSLSPATLAAAAVIVLLNVLQINSKHVGHNRTEPPLDGIATPRTLQSWEKSEKE